MPFFKKKPVVIEAHQWPGGAEAATPIIDWVLAGGGTARWAESYDHRDEDGKVLVVIPERLSIETLEGTMHATAGDWIIKGVKGEFYPCKPDIFEDTYNPVSAAG